MALKRVFSNTRFKNVLARLPLDSEMTDRPKFIVLSVHRRSTTYIAKTPANTRDRPDRN